MDVTITYKGKTYEVLRIDYDCTNKIYSVVIINRENRQMFIDKGPNLIEVINSLAISANTYPKPITKK